MLDLDRLVADGVIPDLVRRRAKGPLGAKLRPTLEALPLDRPPPALGLEGLMPLPAARPEVEKAVVSQWLAQGGLVPWLVGGTLDHAVAAVEPIAEGLGTRVVPLRPSVHEDVVGSWQGKVGMLARGVAKERTLSPIFVLDASALSERVARLVLSHWWHEPHDEGLGMELPIQHARWVVHSPSREVAESLRARLSSEIPCGPRDEDVERRAEDERVEARRAHTAWLTALLEAWQAEGLLEGVTVERLLSIRPGPLPTDRVDRSSREATGLLNEALQLLGDPRRLGWELSEGRDGRGLVPAIARSTGLAEAEIGAMAGELEKSPDLVRDAIVRDELLERVNRRLDETDRPERFLALFDLGEECAYVFVRPEVAERLHRKGVARFAKQAIDDLAR
ncbi:MAG TPA: hypothetical protein RMH99_29720 [Sandaracinaceae bacterium LLY-WYZ-13_1]|nr:hypothetical protein [Sandaracinaceae bacterium LLY-WYZ-13_1]